MGSSALALDSARLVVFKGEQRNIGRQVYASHCTSKPSNMHIDIQAGGYKQDTCNTIL